MKQYHKYYTMSEQNELDNLLTKLNYARLYTPFKVELIKELISDFKNAHGVKLAPFNCVKNIFPA